jgi:ketosteroid isomerase-like protein
MRGFVTIVLFFIYSSAIAQTNAPASLMKAMNDLHAALQNRDTAVLKKLLHEKVAYGHSNGWIEHKQDVIKDLYDGTLVYDKIEFDMKDMKPVIEGNTAMIISEVKVDGRLRGTPFSLKLNVMQAWVKTKQGWQLIGRQSVKL